MQETQVQSLDWEDPQEKEMATHYSILAWRIPWTEEPDGLQSMGWQKVGHNWVTNTHTQAEETKEVSCSHAFQKQKFDTVNIYLVGFS